jgi:hypothetical protein
MSLATESVPVSREKRRPSRTPAARRQRKVRANRKARQHYYGMWLSDRCVEGLILKCLIEGRLTEEQALKPRLVTQALAQILEQEGHGWVR